VSAYTIAFIALAGIGVMLCLVIISGRYE